MEKRNKADLNIFCSWTLVSLWAGKIREMKTRNTYGWLGCFTLVVVKSKLMALAW